MNFCMLVIPLVSIALECQLAEGDSDKCQRLKPLYDTYECRTCKGGNSDYYKCSKFYKNYNPNKCYFNNTYYDTLEPLPGTYPNRDGTKSCTFNCENYDDMYAYFEIENCTDTIPVVNPNECLYSRLYDQDSFYYHRIPVYQSNEKCPRTFHEVAPSGINGTCSGNPDMCCNYLGNLMPVGQKFRVKDDDCFCNCPPLAECIRA